MLGPDLDLTLKSIAGILLFIVVPTLLSWLTARYKARTRVRGEELSKCQEWTIKALKVIAALLFCLGLVALVVVLLWWFGLTLEVGAPSPNW
jgi:hypothetical protein